jgi:glycosyltransferase involved in cell wall biosynthesis
VERFVSHKELRYLVMMAVVFLNLMRLKDIDVIYAHNIVAYLPALIAAKLKRIPLVLDIDDFLSGYSGVRFAQRVGYRIEIFLARFAGLVIATSDLLLSQLQQNGCKRVEKVLHGVDLDLFKCNPRVQKENRIIFVGGIERHDGVDLLPAAAATIIRQFPGIKFVVIGSGRGLALVREEVAARSLESFFEFRDWMDQSLIPEELQRSALSVAPHKTSMAGEISMVMKVFESMAVRTPVLVSDLRGFMEQVEAGRRGFFFRRDDTEDLARRVVEALTDTARYEQIQEAGYLFVHANCSWRENCGVILNLCEQCGKAARS